MFASRRLLPKATFLIGGFYLLAGLMILAVGGHDHEAAMTPWTMGLTFGIGQLSVEDNFDGVLRGELAGNRGLLRCLSGYGSCLWRLERRDEAARVLERVLRLDPADRQGVRLLLSAMRAGAPWSDAERS